MQGLHLVCHLVAVLLTRWLACVPSVGHPVFSLLQCPLTPGTPALAPCCSLDFLSRGLEAEMLGKVVRARLCWCRSP